jgi:hypothetical protein
MQPECQDIRPCPISFLITWCTKNAALTHILTEYCTCKSRLIGNLPAQNQRHFRHSQCNPISFEFWSVGSSSRLTKGEATTCLSPKHGHWIRKPPIEDVCGTLLNQQHCSCTLISFGCIKRCMRSILYGVLTSSRAACFILILNLENKDIQ